MKSSTVAMFVSKCVTMVCCVGSMTVHGFMLMVCMNGTNAQGVIAEDGWVDVQRDFGAIGNGVSNDTAAIQSAMTYAEQHSLPVRIPPGKYLVGPITLGNPATKTNRYSSGQGPGVSRIQGAGRTASTFIAKAGAYSAGEYVLSRNNLCGVHYSGFRVKGEDEAYGALDLSFEYGSGTTWGAPSSLNVLEDIWLENSTTVGANLDGCHDSKVSGLVIRSVNSVSDPIGLSFVGSGGMMSICDTIIASGIVRTGAQNGEFARCGFFDGLEITGAGYNHINFSGCHFYPNPYTRISIDSTATGLGTSALSFEGCYFNGDENGDGDYFIDGNWHAGASFKNCLFRTANSSFFANLTLLDGSGSPPFFVFRHCTFLDNDPVSETTNTNARVVAEFCHKPTGISELRKNY